jgi:hypothetical protein
MHLAFVLLSEVKAPKPDAIARSFGAFASDGETIRPVVPARDVDPATKDVLEFQIGPRGNAFVALVPAAVPRGEADDAARYSVSALGTGWKLAPHTAHLIVTLPAAAEDPAIKSLSTFTSLIAAVAQASGAVGIYWGEAHATHDTEFFISTAREREWAPKLMLWTGISVARESDGRLSLLSLGMKQLGLPDLLMISPQSEDGNALGSFFDLLAYVAERGEPLPEGDTIGRTSDERRPVTYVPSPVDPSKKVWRVEFE